MSETPEVQVTSASQWKKGSFIGKPVELPSGNIARIKVPGMRAFIQSGKVPNSLMTVILSKMEEGKAGKEVEANDPEMLQEFAKNPEQLADLLDMIDLLTIECFVEPKVHPVPDEGETRSDEKLYVDEVDDDDKFYVFSVAVGGPTDLEKFREELDRNVEAVQSQLQMEGSSQ